MKQRTKRIIAWLLTVTMLSSLLVLPVSAAESNGTTVYLTQAYWNADVDTEVTSVAAGEDFYYAVNFNGLPTTPKESSAYGYSILIQYDPAKMAPIEDGTYSDLNCSPTVDNVAIVDGVRLAGWVGQGIKKGAKLVQDGNLFYAGFTAQTALSADDLKGIKIIDSVESSGETKKTEMLDGNGGSFNLVVLPALAVTAPTETVYVTDTMDEIAGKVTAQYIDEDGTATDVDVTVSVKGGGGLAVGKNILVAEYEGYTAEFEVTVADVEIASISVSGSPVLEYNSGDTLDLSGLTVTATYNNGKTRTVSDYTLKLGNEDFAKNTTLTVADHNGKVLTVVAGGKTVDLAPLQVNPGVVAIPTADGTYTYTDREQTFAYGNDSDSDKYTVTGSNQGTNAGKYSVTASLIDKTETAWSDGTITDKTLTWTIDKAKVNKPYLDTTGFEYTGSAQTVTASGFDYDIMTKTGTESATNVGNYQVTVSLIDTVNYQWSDEKQDDVVLNWSITAKALAESDFTFADQEYTGEEIEATPTTSLNVADYDLSYENNVNVGTATVTITGKGNYSGTINKTFEITAKAITPTVTLDLPADGYVYDGNAKTPAVTVTYNGQTLADTTYSVDYQDNTNAGDAAKVIVTSVSSNYSFNVTETFSIAKATQTINGNAFSVKAGGAMVGLSTKFTAEGDLSFAITGENATGSTVSGDVLTPGTTLGSFTLTVTAAETGNYKEATQTFTIQVVEKPSHALTSFGEATLSYTYGDTPTAQTVTSTTGTVKYTSSDSSAVSVNAETGALTIHKVTDGVTITATVAGNDEYAEATASYVVKVAAKELEITGLGATNRAYEAGNVNVTLTGGTLTGKVGSDDVTCVIPTTGTVENANAGNGKVVSVVKPALTGTAAGNYTLKDLPQITVNISKAIPEVGTVSCKAPVTIFESTALADIELEKTGAATGTLVLDNGQVLQKGTNSYNWTFTPADTTNYETVTGTVSLTVVEDTLQSIAVTGTPTKTAYKYGEAFETAGLTVTATYTSGATKDVTADVTFDALSVGQTSVVLTYGGKTCTVTGITVDKADGPAAPSVTGDYTDNADQTKFIYTVDPVANGEYKMDDGEWQGSNVFENIDAGSKHTFYARVKSTETVKEGAAGSTGEVTFSKLDVTTAPTLIYKVTGDSGDRTITVTPVDGAVYSFDGGVTWGTENTKSGLADTTVEIQIRYAETDTRNASTAATATVNTAKQVQAVLTITSGTNVTYGKTLTLSTSGGSGNGAVTYAVTDGTGKATVSGNVLTATQAGTVTVVATKAEDATYGSATSAAVTITIAKATPTGEPAFTKVTASDKTLADAALNVGTINVPGTIVWNDGDTTKVEANKEYGWTFTPDDTANYNTLTGSIKVWSRSSGGSSSSVRYDITVKNSEDGEISAPSKASAGTTVFVTVTPDEGYELSKLTVTDAKGKKISVEETRSGKYTFTMPNSDVTVKATFEEIEEEVEITFSDVNEDAYYFDAVEWAVENGVTTGYANGTFLPNNTCTRAQTVTFLWRAMGCPAPEDDYMPFVDVDEDAYYYDAVLWALENGITTGVTATTFEPNKTVSRAQTVTFLWRTARINGYDVSAGEDTNILSYEDALTIPEYAISALQWACGDDILGGYADGTLRPNAGCTRAHIVTFLYRFLAD